MFFKSIPCSADEFKSLVNAVMNKTAKRRRIIIACCYVMATVSATVVWLLGDSYDARWTFGALAIVSLVTIVMNALTVRRVVKLNAKRAEGSGIMLTEDSIMIAADDYRTELAWQSVQNITETDAGFVLTTRRSGSVMIPRSGLTAMIPTEGEGAVPPQMIDVVGMFRDFISRLTGKTPEKVSGKSKNGAAVVALIVSVVMILATFVADTTTLFTMRVGDGDYSIVLPVNMRRGEADPDGTIDMWNSDVEVYNFIDKIDSVTEYFGYIPTAKEYLNEVIATSSDGIGKNVAHYTLANGTEAVVCSYDDDDCFYIRAVTPSKEGFWTTVMIGWESDRSAKEKTYVEWLGTIEVE